MGVTSFLELIIAWVLALEAIPWNNFSGGCD
jgi:hypothetical protein